MHPHCSVILLPRLLLPRKKKVGLVISLGQTLDRPSTRPLLREFVQENKLSDIRYFIPTPNCRVVDPPIGGTGFYARVLEDGINLPIYPFLCDILESYKIAPG